MTEDRWLVSRLDVAQPLTDLSAPADVGGIHLQLWHRELPLGQLWLPRGVFPMPPMELARAISRAIAPAVGNRIFPHGFRAPLPVTGDNPARDIPPDLDALLSVQTPISDLRSPNCLPRPHLSVIPKTTVPPLRDGCTELPSPISDLRSSNFDLRSSIVVCTRNRPEALEKNLASLASLDPPADEILVVDNDPADERTRAVVQKFPNVTWLPEPAPGLSRARNTGIRHARGEILAWTDDDTIVHPGWIGAVRSVFADPDISAMTGLVLAGALENPAQLHFERDFGGFGRGFRAFTLDAQFFEEMKTRGVPAWQAGAGANMAFRREVFATLGPFDERLGAGAAGCSEDSEYWYRLLAAGQSIRYEPRAVVWHFHRATDDGLQLQMEEYMRGHVAALLFQYQKHRHAGNLRRLFLSLPRHYWSAIRHRTAGRTLAREVRGCLRGIFYYLRNNS